MKTLRWVLILGLIFSFSPMAVASTMKPLPDSPAYQNYAKRPKSDLSKLIFLLDRFKEGDHRVLLNGRQYESEEASPTGKKYLFRNYKNKADARDWINKHCYRSPGTGEIIHFQREDGGVEPLRDVLLAELEALEAFEAKAAA